MHPVPHVIPGEPPDEPAGIARLMRRFFPAFCVLAACVTFGFSRYDPYQIDGDAIAYMDIGDNLRAHNWAGIVDGYWHPLYPAVLSLFHGLFHATLANELRAYYAAGFAIFLLEMAAMVAFTDSIVRLRERMQPPNGDTGLLGLYPLRYMGLALLLIASQRELSLGKIRPDALLQALLLFALAGLLRFLATDRMRYAALMGVGLGCAYLAKSFAFLFAFLCVGVLVMFALLWMKRPAARTFAAAALALVCFGVIAGPYVAALSRQKGRFDFGDSGSLNYAWYVAGTQKMHIEPYMTDSFGSSEVRLKHPEKELLRSPQILSYAAFPWGTNPDWDDTTFWNDQVKPHFNPRGEISRAARNSVLVVRYLLNHPEALILLALMLALGARLRLPLRPGQGAFWLPPVALGATAWGIYWTVNTEERYVTFAYLCIILPLFAALREAKALPATETSGLAFGSPQRFSAWALLPLVLALLAAGESLRLVLEDRRQLAVRGEPYGWYSASQQQAADALHSMGVGPGNTVACVGHSACLGDFYWARLAGLRILTEIYSPMGIPAYDLLTSLPNREQAIAVVRAQGAKVLVGDFAGAPVTPQPAALEGWQQLGDSTLYEFPLNVAPGVTPRRPPPPVRTKPSI